MSSTTSCSYNLHYLGFWLPPSPKFLGKYSYNLISSFYVLLKKLTVTQLSILEVPYLPSVGDRRFVDVTLPILVIWYVVLEVYTTPKGPSPSSLTDLYL